MSDANNVVNISFGSKDYIKLTIIIAVIAATSTELLNSLSTNILIPLIDTDCNKDGKPDLSHNLKNKKIIIKKKIIYTGEFAFVLVKFILIVLFVYFISKIF